MWIYLLIILIIFGAGKLFHLCCPPVIFHGPNSKDIVGTVFEHKESYWTFTPEVIICPLNTRTCASDIMGVKLSNIV